MLTIKNPVRENVNKFNNVKYINIVSTAKRLFLKHGYYTTTVRQIVKEAKTSTGNFYFYFPDKLNLLKIIAKEFITILRNQTDQIKNIGLSPEIGFALDFRLGYIKTLEDPRLSQLWYIIKNTPEINNESLENKKKRLRTFFSEQISMEKLNLLAIAIQGISDSITQQKREGVLSEDSVVLSNTIVEYSMCLLGYSKGQINNTIKKVDEIIKKNHSLLKTMEDYYNI